MSKVVLNDKLKARLKDNRPKQMVTKNPVVTMNNFIRLGHDFDVSSTSRSFKIHNKTQNLVYLSGGKNYTISEFHLQRKLKKVIKEQIFKNGIKTPVYTEKDIKYKLYSEEVLNLGEGEVMDNVIEYDINKAYYQCAYNLGYLSDSMYKECLGMDKEKRLRFLGSIATQKTKYSYVKGKLQEDSFDVVKDDLLRDVWFHICKVVDDCLIDFAERLGDNFLLYYVDGIYLKNFKGRNKMLDKIEEDWGFSFSDTDVKSICKVVHSGKNRDYGTVMITKFSDGKFKEKPFFLSNFNDENISKGLYVDALKDMFVYDEK